MQLSFIPDLRNTYKEKRGGAVNARGFFMLINEVRGLWSGRRKSKSVVLIFYF